MPTHSSSFIASQNAGHMNEGPAQRNVLMSTMGGDRGLKMSSSDVTENQPSYLVTPDLPHDHYQGNHDQMRSQYVQHPSSRVRESRYYDQQMQENYRTRNNVHPRYSQQRNNGQHYENGELPPKEARYHGHPPPHYQSGAPYFPNMQSRQPAPSSDRSTSGSTVNSASPPPRSSQQYHEFSRSEVLPNERPYNRPYPNVGANHQRNMPQLRRDSSGGQGGGDVGHQVPQPRFRLSPQRRSNQPPPPGPPMIPYHQSIRNQQHAPRANTPPSPPRSQPAVPTENLTDKQENGISTGRYEEPTTITKSASVEAPSSPSSISNTSQGSIKREQTKGPIEQEEGRVEKCASVSPEQNDEKEMINDALLLAEVAAMARTEIGGVSSKTKAGESKKASDAEKRRSVSMDSATLSRNISPAVSEASLKDNGNTSDTRAQSTSLPLERSDSYQVESTPTTGQHSYEPTPPTTNTSFVQRDENAVEHIDQNRRSNSFSRVNPPSHPLSNADPRHRSHSISYTRDALPLPPRGLLPNSRQEFEKPGWNERQISHMRKSSMDSRGGYEYEISSHHHRHMSIDRQRSHEGRVSVTPPPPPFPVDANEQQYQRLHPRHSYYTHAEQEEDVEKAAMMQYPKFREMQQHYGRREVGSSRDYDEEGYYMQGGQDHDDSMHRSARPHGRSNQRPACPPPPPHRHYYPHPPQESLSPRSNGSVSSRPRFQSYQGPPPPALSRAGSKDYCHSPGSAGGTMPPSHHMGGHGPPSSHQEAQQQFDGSPKVKRQFETPITPGTGGKSIDTASSSKMETSDVTPGGGEVYHNSPYPRPSYNSGYPTMTPSTSSQSLHNQPMTKKTILKRKCAWKNYPELEAFLITNREEYLRHSAMNYTVQQKQYNNRLTERLLEVAAKHNYIFDENDFNFVAVRDRIRCYYKSYVQSSKKRGIIVGYGAHQQQQEAQIVKKRKLSTSSPDDSVTGKLNVSNDEQQQQSENNEQDFEKQQQQQQDGGMEVPEQRQENSDRPQPQQQEEQSEDRGAVAASSTAPSECATVSSFPTPGMMKAECA